MRAIVNKRTSKNEGHDLSHSLLTLTYHTRSTDTFINQEVDSSANALVKIVITLDIVRSFEVASWRDDEVIRIVTLQ